MALRIHASPPSSPLCQNPGHDLSGFVEEAIGRVLYPIYSLIFSMLGMLRRGAVVQECHSYTARRVGSKGSSARHHREVQYPINRNMQGHLQELWFSLQ